MLSELMAPGTAAIALSLINTCETAVDGELSDALLADNAERLTKLVESMVHTQPPAPR